MRQVMIVEATAMKGQVKRRVCSQSALKGPRRRCAEAGTTNPAVLTLRSRFQVAVVAGGVSVGLRCLLAVYRGGPSNSSVPQCAIASESF